MCTVDTLDVLSHYCNCHGATVMVCFQCDSCTVVSFIQMVSLYRDPQGKKIFDGMDSSSYRVTSTIPSSVTEDGKSEH